MYLTVKQRLTHLTKQEYQCLRELSRFAKNLANEAIYSIRQHYFNTHTYLSYKDNYALLKSSDNYKMLNSNMAQQILKEVDGSFKSFFGLLKLAKQGKYDKPIKLPAYLPKDGFMTLVIGFVRLKGNKLVLPLSNAYKKEKDKSDDGNKQVKKHVSVEITIPPVLVNKKMKEIRIIPKSRARFFEVQYVYEAKNTSKKLNPNNALGLDLGVNNLVTGVTNDGCSFIIDGRRLKSINQWFNKRNAKLQSIKDKQGIKYTTQLQSMLAYNRNNKVNDYISKAARIVIDYCLDHNIGTVVIGYNKDFQQKSRMGKVNNQNFVNIPVGRLCDKLEYLCKLNNIICIRQEESYTSKASFWDRDNIPVYKYGDDTTYNFSGRRIHRGLYKISSGYTFNADVNGAMNIMRKSKVVDLRVLYSRGVVDTPVRIRIA